MKETKATSSFYQLDPETVLLATEEAGFFPTGEFQMLNSYENRVFDIQLESTKSEFSRIIAKCYRPGRWSNQEIKEEHDFLLELQAESVSVAAPIILKNGRSFVEKEGMKIALFPKIRGRMLEEILPDDLPEIGLRLAQLHNVGVQKDFQFRQVMGASPYPLEEQIIHLEQMISPEIRSRYLSASYELLERFEIDISPDCFQRIHGDCHRGNLLANKDDYFFVDFDDSMMGPVVQDIWMLFSSFESEEEQELLIRGYETIREFPQEQTEWIPILRGLRIINYSAWIARRWTDPNFPKLFPNFNSYNYWVEETEALEKIVWSYTRR